jgi:hypothetical protein
MQLNASLAAEKRIAPVASIRAMPGPVMVDVRVISDEVRAPRLQSCQRRMVSLAASRRRTSFRSSTAKSSH